ncbi:MAG: hypothetical protein WAM69_15515 [Candidatus Sulfotelmatobacter sp.]
MSDPDLGNSTPQFGTAEYAEKPGGNGCRFCGQAVGGSYYRVNGARACGGCAEKMRSELGVDKHAAYARAVAYGVGAGVVGIAGYALIAILLQGWVISYMALAVGWLVGRAMMKGSNGVGGRRYQITAALLTYAAVSIAAVPIWIHFAGVRAEQRQIQQQKVAEEQRQLENDDDQPATQPSPAPRAEKPQASVASVGRWLGRMALVGLASPFIQLSDSPGWGVMGLLILFVGMNIAWRITAGRPLEVFGPFADSRPAST